MRTFPLPEFIIVLLIIFDCFSLTLILRDHGQFTIFEVISTLLILIIANFSGLQLMREDI